MTFLRSKCLEILAINNIEKAIPIVPKDMDKLACVGVKLKSCAKIGITGCKQYSAPNAAKLPKNIMINAQVYSLVPLSINLAIFKTSFIYFSSN